MIGGGVCIIFSSLQNTYRDIYILFFIVLSAWHLRAMHFLLDSLPLIKDASAIICYFVLRDGHPFSFILCFTPCIKKPVTQFYLEPLTIKKIDP